MESEESRSSVLARLLEEIERVRPERRILVALDGFDGAGKTHLSAELAELARTRGVRPVVRVSIDGFHRPKAERVAAGSGPEGFYSGSYRYEAFRSDVVDSLREHGSITPAIWDVARNEPVNAAQIAVPPRGIVLVDGIFLQRPELSDVWDAVVWVHAPFEVSVPRGNARFAGAHDPDPEALSNRRYVGGQRLYLAEARPEEQATWILDNTLLAQPTLRQITSPRPHDSVAGMDWRDDRIGSAARGENPTVIAELQSGYAVIGDIQFLPGYCVLLGKDPRAKALADMPRNERVQFLADADLLATAVERACRDADPRFRRTNIDILGNADAFVHAHVWPRYEWEPSDLIWRPVWLYDLTNWENPSTALSEQHDALRASIASHLHSLTVADNIRIIG